jgi:dihydroneopterin aldolase
MKPAMPMDKITIHNLEVHYHIGVSDEERSQPQRLLLCLEMERDFSEAAGTDDLAKTVDYHKVAQRLIRFGDGRNWRLIERLAADLIDMMFSEFAVESVTFEIKKMVIPQAEYVSFSMHRSRP